MSCKYPEIIEETYKKPIAQLGLDLNETHLNSPVTEI